MNITRYAITAAGKGRYQLTTEPNGEVVLYRDCKRIAMEMMDNNTFELPLCNGNRAVISFARLPATKEDFELLRKYLELVGGNFCEPLESERKATP